MVGRHGAMKPTSKVWGRKDIVTASVSFVPAQLQNCRGCAIPSLNCLLSDSAIHSKIDKLLIKTKASGISAAQELRNRYGTQGWAIEACPVKGDKVARALSVQPMFSQRLHIRAEPGLGGSGYFGDGHFPIRPIRRSHGLGHAGFEIPAHHWQGADGRGRAFRGSATDDTPQQAEAAVSGVRLISKAQM